MCHSLIKPCLFQAKWDHPVLHVMHVIIEKQKNAIYCDNMPVSVDRLI